jgi:hypothetical protein
MRSKTVWLAAVAAAAALASPAWAWDSSAPYTPYLGGSVGTFDYVTDGQDKVSPRVGLFRVGVPLSPYFALEGRVGTGLTTEFSDLFGGYDLKIDTLYGGYLKGNLPLTPIASVYALAGYSAVKLRRRFAFSDQTVTDDSTSFGGGLDVNLGRALRLNLEWGRFIRVSQSDDHYHADILSIGLVWLL